MMTKKNFSKTVRIYKSHPVKNGFISITYAEVLGPNTVSTEETICIENKGGALTSLYYHNCPTAAALTDNINKVDFQPGNMSYMDCIKERISNMDDGNADISIVGRFNIKDGNVFQFEFNGEKAAIIIYNDGTIFQQSDWQSGCPESPSEIENFEWLTENRKDAFIVDGLPRVL